MKQTITILLLAVGSAVSGQSLLTPVPFSQVVLHDTFWKPRMDTVIAVTIPVCMDQTEIKTPRLRNFEKVARHRGEKHEGIYYDDSDVYKALEAIAYALKDKPDPALEKRADDWINKVAAAQLPDGYLNTYYTLGDLNKRWTDMAMHEDYNGGHLIEAGVAYFEATGKRKLLDVSIRFANHVDSQFGPGKRHWVTGHEELELALVKLFRATGNRKYLALADWLLGERGHRYGYGYSWTNWHDTAYAQDVTPVKQTREITGHAVRAMYLYTGAADVAHYAQDEGYTAAMKQVWEDVVYRNMYITGGIGSSGTNEGFTADYDLPNENAYCETCASVGMVFWNQRMNQLTGESKYIDVLEKSLYNAASDGLSLKGSTFFYENPLTSDGQTVRRPWYGTACCPANIARLISSLGNYLYAQTQDGLWVNLFVGSETQIKFPGNTVRVSQTTNYPWDGDIRLLLEPEHNGKFGLHIRIPGWAQNQASPGNTYVFLNNDAQLPKVTLNGHDVAFTMVKGYAVVEREWKKGDEIRVHFPMEIRRVVAIDRVKDDQNRVALQRGPLIYCLEHADNDGQAQNVILPDEASLTSAFHPEILQGVVMISGDLLVVKAAPDGLSLITTRKKITAIPYYAWANRGAGEMEVWIPRKVTQVKLSSR
jgi:DUF1680 family protein